MPLLIASYEGVGLTMACLLVGSLAATAVLTPAVMRMARRVGAVDRGGHRKVGKHATPLLGGLAVGIPFVALCAAASGLGWYVLGHYTAVYRNVPRAFDALYEISTQYKSFAVLAAGAAAIMLVGIVDDVRGLRARHKLLAQLVIAAFVCLAGRSLTAIELPLLGVVHFPPAVSIAICMLWIAGMINAMNIIDGVDGLAAGISLIAACAMCAISAINGNLFMFAAATALAGSLAAFLVFNFNPARVFLGDTGSMLLGFILATLTLMGQSRTDTALIVLAPLLALSLPIFETFLSMARRFLRGLPIFTGDSQHTHHRLLSKGYSQRRVVLMLYGVAFLLAASAVTSQALPEKSRWSLGPMAFSMTALVWVTWLAGYLRPSSMSSLIERRRRNGLLAALTRYAMQSLGSPHRLVGTEEIFHLCRCEMKLTFLEAVNQTRGLPIAASGQPVEDLGETDAIIQMKINTANGQQIALRYQFGHHPDELEARAVSTALATIFENTDIALPPAKVLDVNDAAAGGREAGSRRKQSS